MGGGGIWRSSRARAGQKHARGRSRAGRCMCSRRLAGARRRHHTPHIMAGRPSPTWSDDAVGAGSVDGCVLHRRCAAEAHWACEGPQGNGAAAGGAQRAFGAPVGDSEVSRWRWWWAVARVGTVAGSGHNPRLGCTRGKDGRHGVRLESWGQAEPRTAARGVRAAAAGAWGKKAAGAGQAVIVGVALAAAASACQARHGGAT